MYKLMWILLFITHSLNALEWKETGEIPFPGERIFMTRESHDNQQSEMGWVVHYSPTIHKRLLQYMIWTPLQGNEKELFDLGVPFFYTP